MKKQRYTQFTTLLLIALLLFLSCHTFFTLGNGAVQHSPFYQVLLFGFIVVSFFQLILFLIFLVILPQTKTFFIKNLFSSFNDNRAPPLIISPSIFS